MGYDMGWWQSQGNSGKHLAMSSLHHGNIRVCLDIEEMIEDTKEMTKYIREMTRSN
jgi:hypothetical protein